MRIKRVLTAAAVAGAALMAGGAAHETPPDAVADMVDIHGKSVGDVRLTATPSGVLLKARLWNLPPGTHAFHIHETGSCARDFAAAGGHYNPDGKEHGLRAEGGPHAGDFPNIHVPDNGVFVLEAYNERLKLKGGLLDSDGSAIVIHRGADDYRTNPAGAAGERLACGVIEA